MPGHLPVIGRLHLYQVSLMTSLVWQNTSIELFFTSPLLLLKRLEYISVDSCVDLVMTQGKSTRELLGS